MSFIYPLFLTAGLSLAIPLLIHLFNLRKYKTVFFPHTRFLKNIQLNSRKQSQLKYKWLLAARMLFLLALILAFAQPYMNNEQKTEGANKVQIIYLDNSYSMSVKKGPRTMLDIAKENARQQIKNGKPGTRYLLLTNDKPISYRPEPADKVFDEINRLDFSSSAKTGPQVMSMLQGMMQNDMQYTGADLYYYSDFQQSSFPDMPDQRLLKNVTFYGVPMRADEVSDVYIDTAYLLTPVLQTGKTNKLIVHSKLWGKNPKEQPVLQLMVNKQVKSAATLNFEGTTESIDTLNFMVNDAGWQNVQLLLNDATVRFDDTFRIAARSGSSLAILVLNEGQMNPYLQAAFRAYEGFRINQEDVMTGTRDWTNYNLIILNGVTRIDATLGASINDALQRGQSICIFPGKTNNFQAINEGLKLAGDIRISSIDTTQQTATALQQGSTLVKDLFEHIPENVQLPVANWHYSITANLSANQQSVLSFRNGDPLFSRYTPSRGQLYICATSADLQSGNFPGSYFFTPFLYQMAMQSGSSNIYAVTAGNGAPLYVPLSGSIERSTLHMYATGIDVIPQQKANGAGIDVYAGLAIEQPGFYQIAAPAGDTTLIGVNQDKRESALAYRDMNALRANWKGDNIKWAEVSSNGAITAMNGSSFPIWKICALIAVLMLFAETWLLAASKRIKTA